MSGIVEIDALLQSMSPQLQRGEYVFCTVNGGLGDYIHLNPLGVFAESEGLTLIVDADRARVAGLEFDGLFRQITLTVHSSLEAVGLTAAVSAKLTSRNISANVVAAFYHDHIFVQKDKAAEALSALQELAAAAAERIT